MSKNIQNFHGGHNSICNTIRIIERVESGRDSNNKSNDVNKEDRPESIVNNLTIL